MAAGDRVIDADGNRGLLSGGARSVFDASGECAECCEVCSPSDAICGNCDDLSPISYTVVFSEIILCTDCFATIGYPSGDSARVSWQAGDVLNTSHTLTQSPTSNCEWTITLTDAIFEEIFFDAACASADVDGVNDVYIKLTRNATTWTLAVTTEFNSHLFYDVQTADVDPDNGDQLCATVPAFTSDLTTCGDITVLGADVATGGGATVTCP